MSEFFLKFFQELRLIIRIGKVATSFPQACYMLVEESQLSLVDAASRQELKARFLPVEDS